MAATFAGRDGNVYDVRVNRIAFIGMCLLIAATCAAQADDLFKLKALQQSRVEPVLVKKTGDGAYFIDFGRDAFGWLELDVEAPADSEMTVRLGEKLKNGVIDLKPGGTIRHAEVKIALKAGAQQIRVETPIDKRNTSGDAVLLPKELGVVMPFRYAEILHSPSDLHAKAVTQIAVHYPFAEFSSHFRCSDDRLNKVWDLCKYSIKATSFAGIFVDGDRERIPYEADAYLNQLSWYCTDGSLAISRHTHEYLLKHPTWPTEWKQFSVLMAYQDWMYSGNADSIRRNWDLLKSEKMMSSHARADGLIDSSKLKDVIDWPAGERDGFVMSPVNAVVNAFHYRTLVCMSEMARAIGKSDEAADFDREAEKLKAAFNGSLFDATNGIYFDGEGIKHSSLHANLFPLAFGLVPEDRRRRVVAFIKSRGMACSVYPAQFLLEALFENNEVETALSLMTTDSDRGWLHMLDFGSTITTEAWDIKFKPNMDWNHAWGAAPANILPRYVLGVRPIEPGFTKAIIAPQIGKLEWIDGVVPTIQGSIAVKWRDRTLELTIPQGVDAHVVMPDGSGRTFDLKSGTHSLQ